MIDAGTRQDRLGNSLVVVVPNDSPLVINSASDLANANVRQIALADPHAVPAGVYAKAWLDKLRLWPAVEPKVIPTENVRAALAAASPSGLTAGTKLGPEDLDALILAFGQNGIVPPSMMPARLRPSPVPISHSHVRVNQ